MQANDVPMKTAAGHREIGQRAHKLSPRSRSMLIMIHGDQTIAEISHSMRSLGDTAAIFSELAGLGLIVAEPADVQVHAAGAGSGVSMVLGGITALPGPSGSLAFDSGAEAKALANPKRLVTATAKNNRVDFFM